MMRTLKLFTFLLVMGLATLAQAYPTFVLATLDQINETSCPNTPQHRMKLVASSNPPEYNIEGVGDFAYARLVRVVLTRDEQGEELTVTWDLTIVYLGGGACHGGHLFRREFDADDPEGGFLFYFNGEKDEALGLAGVADDT